MASDVELLTRWRGGERQAGNVLVRRHFSAVYRFFRNKAPQAASDLAQQTFLALAEGHDRLEMVVSFQAYVYGVARHKLVHHLRERYAQAGVFTPDEMSALAVAPDPGTSPTRRLADAQRRELLDAALRSLPLDQQIVLELHYWKEMKLVEIGAVLECNPGSVKSRLHRARRALHREFTRRADGPIDLERELSSMRG